MEGRSLSVGHPKLTAAYDAKIRKEAAGRHYVRDPSLMRGAVADFDRVLGLPTVLLGFTNPDDNAHSPNESLVLANYEGGARTVARYWQARAED